ncbi:hypothetical protein PVK06_017940 [Gossypium arboreum]|uniref:RNase H type-1 domain-containing protein n=1 Tax=Gossypium arboreum TaxID=29729 RepID=A0ABR0Q4V0_GOSAR|nr:hypothetical protein PVK06_017940 [Gossypium arboreum]
MEWFTWFVQNSSTDICRYFLRTIWAIWSARNKWIHEGKKMSGAETARFRVQYLQELNSIKRGKLAFSPISVEWRPPIQRFYKINFDAAVDLKTQRSFSGLLVRDWKGEILATKTINHENIPTGFAAEAVACLQAVILGRDLRLNKFLYARRKANEQGHDLASKGLKMAGKTYLTHGPGDEGVTEAEIDRVGGEDSNRFMI